MDAAHPENYKVQTVTDLRSLHRGVSNDIATLSLVSSWGILLLAALSAGTTLYLSVQTRRGEIALRRAVGASKAAVRRMFLLEGLFYWACGRYFGDYARHAPDLTDMPTQWLETYSGGDSPIPGARRRWDLRTGICHGSGYCGLSRAARRCNPHGLESGFYPQILCREQITIRYLLADIISTRALGTGGEMYPTEPHLLRSRTSCIPRFLERQ